MLDASELREPISIQSVKEVVNDMGGTEYQHITICTPRAKVKYMSTKEYITSNSETVKYVVKFIIRVRKVSNDDIVTFKNEQYSIKHVFPFEDRTFMELTCERIV